MPIVVWAAAAAVIVSLPVLGWALLPDDGVRRSSGVRLNQAPKSLRDVRLQQGVVDRVLAPLVGSLAGRAQRFTPVGALTNLEHKIQLSGLASKWTIERLLATKLLAAGAGAVLGVVMLLAAPSVKTFVLAAVIVAGSFVMPDMILDRRAKERAKQIQKELPDMLDQMTVGVEAGLGFDAALARVARENEGPFAEEIGRMLQDRQLGLPREEAFAKLLERTDAPDLKHFVVAITQASKLGMPLANVLRVQAVEMRQKRRVRAEEKALKLPVKLVLPLVLCILPALFIVILGPAVVRLTASGGLGG